MAISFYFKYKNKTTIVVIGRPLWNSHMHCWIANSITRQPLAFPNSQQYCQVVKYWQNIMVVILYQVVTIIAILPDSRQHCQISGSIARQPVVLPDIQQYFQISNSISRQLALLSENFSDNKQQCQISCTIAREPETFPDSCQIPSSISRQQAALPNS